MDVCRSWRKCFEGTPYGLPGRSGRRTTLLIRRCAPLALLRGQTHRSGELPADDAAAFAIGLKLFREVMLQPRDPRKCSDSSGPSATSVQAAPAEE